MARFAFSGPDTTSNGTVIVQNASACGRHNATSTQLSLWPERRILASALSAAHAAGKPRHESTQVDRRRGAGARDGSAQVSGRSACGLSLSRAPLEMWACPETTDNNTMRLGGPHLADKLHIRPACGTPALSAGAAGCRRPR